MQRAFFVGAIYCLLYEPRNSGSSFKLNSPSPLPYLINRSCSASTMRRLAERGTSLGVSMQLVSSFRSRFILPGIVVSSRADLSSAKNRSTEPDMVSSSAMTFFKSARSRLPLLELISTDTLRNFNKFFGQHLYLMACLVFFWQVHYRATAHKCALVR